MSFRKAVAQAYCLHKHVVDEFHYEQHFWGAELAQSALEKKKGADCASPHCKCSTIAAYHAPLGGQSVVRHPLVTRFLRVALRLRPPAREVYAKWWIRMLFHSLESSDLSSPWGSRLTPPEVGLRDTGPAHFSHSRLLCSLALVVLFHTRQGFESLAAWASRSHSIFDAARVPEGERLQVTYITMFPRGNKTLRLGAILPASLRALASFLEADAGSTCF